MPDGQDERDRLPGGSVAIFEGQRIRRHWHDGRWFFSVIDVVGLLTGSPQPRVYWGQLKGRLASEGAEPSELVNRCLQFKLSATDGKLRETDCADFITIAALIQYLPALYRRERTVTSGEADTCGVYAIRNSVTQDEYIGSSLNVAQRFAQHLSLLRRGKHHAGRLQDAWSIYGEGAFSLIVLQEVAEPAHLVTAEQRYLDERRPAYNDSRIATHFASSDPIPPSRIQHTLHLIYQANGGNEESALFRAVEVALAYGVFAPGPHFALLLQADSSGVGAWEGFERYLRQQDLE
jgi:hypothetical protein